MRHLLLPVVLLICAPACAAGLPPMPLASVPALSAGPRLDGRLEDAAWKDAALLGPLCRADGAGMPEAGTVARVFAGGEHLALGIVCEEPEMARLQSAPAGHDAQIWVGDCVEVFVQPSAGRPYLHFVTNAHGARYEEREKDSSWDAPWEAAGYRGDGRWSVEILLSWAALGGRPAAGAQWRLNVCRSRRPQMETSTWSPTGGGFHVPERFGTVRFGATAWLADLDWGRPWRGAQRLQARAAGGALSLRVGSSAPAQAAPGSPVSVAYTADGEGTVALVLTAASGKESIARQLYLLRVEPLEPAFRAAADALSAARKGIAAGRLAPAVREALDGRRLALSGEVARLRAIATDAAVSQQERDALTPSLDALARDAGHLSLRAANAAGARELPAYSLGAASALVKILPSRPFSTPLVGSLRLSAARNEVAAAQIVLVAHEQGLKGVTLAVEGPAGDHAPRLAWRRVGTVTTRKPVYAVEHVGEWPDPLLPAAAFDVPAGGRATLWIDARVPEGCPAGEHRAALRVRPANAPERLVPVVVRVRNFAIPREHHLRTAFGLGAPGDFDQWMRNYLDHRISPYSPGAGVKVTRRPAFDWKGARALLAKVRTPRPIGLRLLLDTAKGRAATEPVAVPAGGWQEVRFPLPALEGPVQGFHFALEPFGAATVDLDDLRLDLPAGARAVDSCNAPACWSAPGAWARCEAAPDATEGRGAIRWSVRPAALSGWLDRWPLLSRPAGAGADIPLEMDFSAFDAAVERYRPLGLDSFIVGLPGLGREASEGDAADALAHGHVPLQAAAWERHLKEKGWLERGYTYLFDEPEPAHYPALNRYLGAVKTAAPGIRNMMTARAFPKELTYVDIWCPELCSFDAEACSAEQRRGKEITWYVAFSTRHPSPNFWVDYPALDCRVLFWMTWKHNIEGVLYWSGTYWQVDPWKDPMTFPGANGDGSLLYPGPNKEPIDSLRWECIRDGVEDYEVFCLLEAARDALKGNPKAARLVREANALLAIDDDVVKSYRDYNPDPERLLAAREKMDDCLERCVRVLGKEPVVAGRPRFPAPLPPAPLPPLAAPTAALAAADLPALPAPQPEPGLAARYDFGGTWPFAADLSGAGSHSLVLGGKRGAGPGGRPALAFGGEHDGVRLPGAASLLGAQPSEGSLALWVRPDFDPAALPAGQWDGYQVIAYLMESDGNGLPDGYDEIGLYLHGGHLLARAGGTGPVQFAGIPCPLQRGEWTHLALTFAPGRRVLYVNGRAAAVNTAAYPAPRLDGFPAALGYHPPAGRWRFQGALADTRLYRRALSEVEVAALARGK